jgi:hypothetical protein
VTSFNHLIRLADRLGKVEAGNTYASRQVYAACRRSGLDGEWPYPHYGLWGRTLPLAICGAVMRAYAALVKG